MHRGFTTVGLAAVLLLSGTNAAAACYAEKYHLVWQQYLLGPCGSPDNPAPGCLNWQLRKECFSNCQVGGDFELRTCNYYVPWWWSPFDSYQTWEGSWEELCGVEEVSCEEWQVKFLPDGPRRLPSLKKQRSFAPLRCRMTRPDEHILSGIFLRRVASQS